MENHQSSFAIIKPNRLVVVEPVVFLFALFTFPMQLNLQLYILSATRNAMINKNDFVNISSHVDKTIDLCHLNASDPVVIFNGEVQKKASYFSLMIKLCSSLPALFVSLFLGSYSDKAGRKYAILPPLISFMLTSAVYVVIFLLKLSVWYLLIGAFISGLGGFFNTLLSGCFAYISDTTPPDKRRFRITVLEMCLLMPGILSPLGAGKLLEMIGFGYSLTITLVGQGIITVYVIFFVPETIQKDPSAKFFNLSHLRKFRDVFAAKGERKRNVKLIILLIAYVTCAIPMMDLSLETLFLKNRPLCMKDSVIGYYLAAFLGAGTIGGIIAARLMKFCMSDRSVAVVAGLASVMLNMYKAFVQNIIMMFLSPLFNIFSMLYIPALKTLLSNTVGESEQGVVFGMVAFVELLCSVIGVAIFNPIYASTQNLMTGFVFIVIAMFYFVGCCVLVAYIIISHHNAKTVRVYACDTEQEPLIGETEDQQVGEDTKYKQT